jgi:hypothetical protein
MTNGGPELAPYEPVPAQNNGWTPLFITVTNHINRPVRWDEVAW